MSTRALRKLQGSDILAVEENSDVPENSPVNEDDGNTEDIAGPVKSSKKKKKKSKPANPFDLLGDEEDGDEEHKENSENLEEDGKSQEDIQQSASLKKKKKKKRKKKENAADKTDTPEDEIDASIREVNEMLGELPVREDGATDDSTVSRAGCIKAVLNVEHKNLNPENEMRRIFGANVVQADHTRHGNRRNRNRPMRRNTWLIQPKNTWPHLSKTGLSMNLVDTNSKGQFFVFEHNKEYQKVQFQFLEAVESMEPQNLINMGNIHPHHIDTLLQLSEVCKMSEDLQMAAEFIERALYTFECAFHPLFSLTQGSARLDYRQQENRAFYIALFRHINFIGSKGCYRTALEFCKLILSLDPDGDPLCVLLLIDFYALRAGEYKFLIQLYNEWEAHKNLIQLPNFAFSLPLTMFHVAIDEGHDVSQADDMLQKSLIMFPGLLMPLLDKCSVAPDSQVSSHSFFGPSAQYSQPKALEQLIGLYIGRTHSCWKEATVLSWLERNVREVLSRVDAADPIVEDYATKRSSRYQGTPRNIHRHIIMSEVKEATSALPPDLANVTVMSYDPIPPLNSVAGYTRPVRQTRAQQSSNPLSMFFQSLLPNYNPQDLAPDAADGAVGGQNFRQGVVNVMDAMRDLLNNIRPVAPPVENQEDADREDDDQEWD